MVSQMFRLLWNFLIFGLLFLINGLFLQKIRVFPSPILILPTEDTSATSGPIKNVNNLKCVKIDRW